MPHTTTKNKRTKRPDFRPNGKRRRKAAQAEVEKDRLGRVAANELKGKLLAPLKHETITEDNDYNKHKRSQVLRKKKQSPEAIRFRALHKLLRQIVALEEKQNSGVTLNEAQLAKLGRFDDVAAEMEELQKGLEENKEEEEEASDDESEEEWENKTIPSLPLYIASMSLSSFAGNYHVCFATQIWYPKWYRQGVQ